MPLPLGHAAIGLTAHELYSKHTSVLHRWKVFLFVSVLANSPDVDILIGLLLQGNGNAFHRGPTHSFVFALLMGLLASETWKLWSQIPRFNFRICFLLVLTHLLADFFLTSSPISFLWPLEVNWSSGYSGWGEVINSVFFGTFHDAGIITGCGLVLILNAIFKRHFSRFTSVVKHLH